ncbi:hypothetical protein A3F66_04830 [candidate division TM6 bacterium RIFCSPHIGHO2_12_FULL_32_22]|nr:MAG: hypothetical protein A3F66_04830 [candidate division TM6 bacterium RIFCSPHIGHO2_12_FULL_32_22]
MKKLLLLTLSMLTAVNAGRKERKWLERDIAHQIRKNTGLTLEEVAVLQIAKDEGEGNMSDEEKAILENARGKIAHYYLENLIKSLEYTEEAKKTVENLFQI